MMRTPDPEERQLAQEIRELSMTAWMQSREHYARLFREAYPLAAAVLEKQSQPLAELGDPVEKLASVRATLGDVADFLQALSDKPFGDY
uniref:Uncharacterized protein n=1 Tax=Podoviridae sp. ctlpi2 TaxID=2826574 RepID=A0A8S5MLE1_9CAUD|nr:MAG TPA: hypothetical protein [Podoviridae sp. ctlpi2]